MGTLVSEVALFLLGPAICCCWGDEEKLGEGGVSRRSAAAAAWGLVAREEGTDGGTGEAAAADRSLPGDEPWQGVAGATRRNWLGGRGEGRRPEEDDADD